MSLTANIEEVMKFYNLHNRSFETDFSFNSIIAGYGFSLATSFYCLKYF